MKLASRIKFTLIGCTSEFGTKRNESEEKLKKYFKENASEQENGHYS